MKKVIISTDSPADLPAAIAEKYNVAICPLHVILGGEDRLDGVNITTEEIFSNYLDEETKLQHKDISAKRRAENSAYLTLRYNMTRKLTGLKQRMEQKKYYRFYKCPKCGIDSVIPGNVDEVIDEKLLEEMNEYWF